MEWLLGNIFNIGTFLAILQVGIMIGGYFGKKEVRGTFDELIQDHRSQKKEMWNKIKERI